MISSEVVMGERDDDVAEGFAVADGVKKEIGKCRGVKANVQGRFKRTKATAFVTSMVIRRKDEVQSFCKTKDRLIRRLGLLCESQNVSVVDKMNGTR